jgi:DNA-binding transcriptional regulator YhcF (GntR family)
MVSGRYLGHWRPGDRLPSIREIAEAENVDRKTAAAAYRRLEEEGLVRVRARSGVYLSSPTASHAPGPLERLYRRWLENTYEGAAALGLDTRNILRLVTAMAEVERQRLPVIESDWAQAEAMAGELRDRLGVRATPCVIGELHNSDPLVTEAPLLVSTPYHAAEVTALAPGRLVIETTLSPELLRQLARRVNQGPVTIIAPQGAVVGKLQRALQQCGLSLSDSRLRIVAFPTAATLWRAHARRATPSSGRVRRAGSRRRCRPRWSPSDRSTPSATTPWPGCGRRCWMPRSCALATCGRKSR